MLSNVHLRIINRNRQTIHQIAGSYHFGRRSVVGNLHAVVIHGCAVCINRNAIITHGESFSIDGQCRSTAAISHISTISSIETVSYTRHIYIKRLRLNA